MPLDTSAPALELFDICKRFGTVEACRNVTLRLPAGTVTAIVGENGAGKSTIMNVAFGLYRPDAGEIRVGGKKVRFFSPADAIACGIGMVHQHFKLVETFTVLENLALGDEGGALLEKGFARVRARLAEIAAEYGLCVPWQARIADLSVGQRQRVEILKALIRGAHILILDEPTAVLTPQETQALFAVVRALKEKGVAVALISHKLKDVMAVADRICVMRAGRVAAERAASETDAADLAELMIGRKVPVLRKRTGTVGGDVLYADGISLAAKREKARLSNVSLHLRAGEIVGVAGVSGNGQTDLLEVLAGLRAPTGGRFGFGEKVFDARHPAAPALLRRLGLSYIPEDRLRCAMAEAHSAAETAILGRQRCRPFTDKYGRLDAAAARAMCLRLMSGLDVRPVNPDLAIAGFSGGNQQKLVVGRETSGPPRLLLAGQPTRGADIGAASAIHDTLMALRGGGTAILLVSSDLDEILALSDRILVMGGGQIVGEVPASQADARTLGLMMGQAWGTAA